MRHYAIIINLTDEQQKTEPKVWLRNFVTVFKEYGNYVIQMEKGETCGRLHGQAMLKTKQYRNSTLAKELEARLEFNEGAVQVQACKSKEALKRYCSKESTRVCGPEAEGFAIPKKVKDPLEGKELYEWQQKIEEIVKGEPSDRKIHWFWEPTGGAGKSSFVKHIYLKHPGEVMLCGGRGQDIFYAVNEKIKIYFVDIPRVQYDQTNFSALEALKNGLIFSPKYESGVKCFDIPHIIVFANGPPPEGVWSEDRYDVHCI